MNKILRCKNTWEVKEMQKHQVETENYVSISSQLIFQPVQHDGLLYCHSEQHELKDKGISLCSLMRVRGSEKEKHERLKRTSH